MKPKLPNLAFEDSITCSQTTSPNSVNRHFVFVASCTWNLPLRFAPFLPTLLKGPIDKASGICCGKEPSLGTTMIS